MQEGKHLGCNAPISCDLLQYWFRLCLCYVLCPLLVEMPHYLCTHGVLFFLVSSGELGLADEEETIRGGAGSGSLALSLSLSVAAAAACCVVSVPKELACPIFTVLFLFSSVLIQFWFRGRSSDPTTLPGLVCGLLLLLFLLAAPSALC